jgi:aspartate ammonia-lyase
MTYGYRIEHDSLGELRVPSDAYYGVQTVRAVENFPITGVTVSSMPLLIRALGLIKKAAAQANFELELLDQERFDAIIAACDDVISGRMDQQFVVDVIQGGAGTSTNMNANEVIANRALEISGRPRGQYEWINPNDHVNLSQSTNDVYPTAAKVALQFTLNELIRSVELLSESFLEKGGEFQHILTMGRTQLQDAVPMTLGQEFTAYGVMIGEDVARIRENMSLISEINLGATAVGTGINSHPRYRHLVRNALNKLTGLNLSTATDLIEATQDTGAFVHLSGILKRVAVKLSKVSDDLRLLSSGPRAGLNEINLPPMQPGSTIMPGKVNPVIPEVANQVAFQVMGYDTAITFAAASGQLQLNAFLPLITHNLLRSAEMLTRACTVLAEKCVKGITANKEQCDSYVERSIGIITVLNPIIGYEHSAEVAKEALKTNRGICELVVERGWMTREQLDQVLRPEMMISPVFVEEEDLPER